MVTQCRRAGSIRGGLGLGLLAVAALAASIGAIRSAPAQPLIVRSFPVGAGAKRVALTFDDGPHSKYTPQLLDVLKQYNAHATFFLIGVNATNRKQLVRKISAEGHEVGIHSWAHSDLRTLSSDAITKDLKRCQELLGPLLDREIRWVRPPYGGLNSRVQRAINDASYRVAMWSVDPRDWTGPGSKVVANRVLSRVGNGSVVVMHDSGGAGGTVKAMKTVIPKLIERGYELVTLSELVGLVELATHKPMVVTIGDREFDVVDDFGGVTVRVNGHEVPMARAPVQIEGQFLLPARPVLEALRVHCQWNAESGVLEILGPGGRYAVTPGSLEITVNGMDALLSVPPVVYEGQTMLPARLIADAAWSGLSWNGPERAIEFTSTLVAPARQ